MKHAEDHSIGGKDRNPYRTSPGPKPYVREGGVILQPNLSVHSITVVKMGFASSHSSSSKRK